MKKNTLFFVSIVIGVAIGVVLLGNVFKDII